MTVEQSFRDSVTLLRIDLFETAKMSYNLPKVMKLGTIIPYLKKIQKYVNHLTHLFFSADISITNLHINAFF